MSSMSKGFKAHGDDFSAGPGTVKKFTLTWASYFEVQPPAVQLILTFWRSFPPYSSESFEDFYTISQSFNNVWCFCTFRTLFINLLISSLLVFLLLWFVSPRFQVFLCTLSFMFLWYNDGVEGLQVCFWGPAAGHNNVSVVKANYLENGRRPHLGLLWQLH